MTWRNVEHVPAWVPANLPVDAEGNTRPGFICVHELENGNGQCGGDVFRVEDSIGRHSCIVDTSPPESCAHCGIPSHVHGTSWVEGVGWHPYKQPSTDLIQTRMRARFAAKETR